MVTLRHPHPTSYRHSSARGYTIPALVYRYLLGKSLDIRREVTSPCYIFLSSCGSHKERMPMRTHIYSERDYAFGQTMVTLRTAMHLTQAGLARLLGVSRGAVLGWEAGSSYPKAERLKRFIALGVEHQAWALGREEEEIRAIWQAAHQKVLLDEAWLSALLGERPNVPARGSSAGALPVARPAPGRRVDWDDAPDVPSFYVRRPELACLWLWGGAELCRGGVILGRGGSVESWVAVSAVRLGAGV